MLGGEIIFHYIWHVERSIHKILTGSKDYSTYFNDDLLAYHEVESMKIQ